MNGSLQLIHNVLLCISKHHHIFSKNVSWVSRISEWFGLEETSKFSSFHPSAMGRDTFHYARTKLPPKIWALKLHDRSLLLPHTAHPCCNLSTDGAVKAAIPERGTMWMKQELQFAGIMWLASTLDWKYHSVQKKPLLRPNLQAGSASNHHIQHPPARIQPAQAHRVWNPNAWLRGSDTSG